MTADQFRNAALSLPDAIERETWGEATFRVKEKIFAIMSADGKSASLKASSEDQEFIIASDPKSFSVAPYVGRFGWVSVRLSTVDPDMVRELLREAWRGTAPRKQVAEFDARSE
ncbi:MAG: MmcQ/YjbR family DNA-binding protein [Chloroflexi bacterium]|nr:MmcQ/YjbR family DNA-binding protein [Chloroflexota bacterium]